MVDNDKESIQSCLKANAWFNGGKGMIISANYAKILRAMGIEGPYCVDVHLPTSKEGEER